jgi:hypothetical protein
MTINVTTVSKHFYEIKILPIIRTLCLEGLHKRLVNYNGGQMLNKIADLEKNGT